MLENRIPTCGIDFETTKEVIKEVDALADSLRKEIMESPTTVTVTGKSYYVSEKNGDDSNDGLSPEKPWKTLKNVNEGPVTYHDGVFFERGGIYRGQIVCRAGVTYSAYGKGEKPRIYASPENGADADKWTLLEGTENIWVYATKMKDIGLIVFNEGECHSVKRIPSFVNGKYVKRYQRDVEFDVVRDLANDLDHFCSHNVNPDNGFPAITEPGTLYLRCDKGNPGKVFSSIEFCARNNVVQVGGWFHVHVDNLAIMYGGCHGVGAGTCTGLHVTNCYFGWIGGCIQFYVNRPDTNGHGTVVRYGNSIEIYGGCDDYICDHNYIYQAYDAGMTHQLSRGGEHDCRQKNIKYTRNLVEYCTYSLEYFLGMPDSINGIRFQQNILVKDNIFRYAGFGFGEQRPEYDCPAAHIKGWDHFNPLDENYVYEGNIFDRSRNMMIHCGAGKKQWLPKFRNNIFIQYLNGPESTLGRYDINPTKLIPYNENVREAADEMGLNTEGGLYFAEKDWLYDLPDFTPKNGRD